eukprot:7062160-Prymnesium_polylepis.1
MTRHAAAPPYSPPTREPSRRCGVGCVSSVCATHGPSAAGTAPGRRSRVSGTTTWRCGRSACAVRLPSTCSDMYMDMWHVYREGGLLLPRTAHATLGTRCTRGAEHPHPRHTRAHCPTRSPRVRVCVRVCPHAPDTPPLSDPPSPDAARAGAAGVAAAAAGVGHVLDGADRPDPML